MQRDAARRPARQRWAQLAVAVAGVVTIVGSGGGFPDIDFTNSPPPVIAPVVTITPGQTTVQAGGTAEFRARVTTSGQVQTYRWRRDGVDIRGADGPSYTLFGAQLGDDGARFTVVVTTTSGTGFADAVLLVSPRAPAVYADTEFPLSNWSVTAVAQPAQGGPTAVVAQASDGGNPGAHRIVEYRMTPAPSALRLVHYPTHSTYAPAIQGEIRSIDLALDCNRIAWSDALVGATPTAWPAFEQAGRLYVAASWSSACVGWYERTPRSLLVSDFQMLAGSACNASESCPDFSAGAPPLRFGVVTELTLSGSTGGGSLTQSIDNWRTAVWAR